jgi:hypothetical protein
VRGFDVGAADPFRVLIEYGNNWVRMNSFPIAIQGPLSAAALTTSIERLLISGPMRERDKSSLSILLIGKSAGAILIWNGLRLGYDYFRDFHRIAGVLIDPHGAVAGDSVWGPYEEDQDLWWPSNWSSDHDFFRIYNVYQREAGLNGANFPDSRVFYNRQILPSEPLFDNRTDIRLNHTNIPMHRISRKIINCALDFVNSPRGETVSKPPLNIVIQNGRGRFGSTVNGNEGIIFVVENLNRYRCDCLGANVQISGKHTVLKTWEATTNQLIRYRPPPGIHRLDINVKCGTQHAHKAVHLDYEPPTFDSIEVNPHTHRERSMVLNANRVKDDGYWNESDYQVEVTLDGRQVYSGSGFGITLNNLAEGRHSATMRISDGFGRWSDIKSRSFIISSDRPNLAFIEPRENARIPYSSNLDIVVEASHPSGIMRMEIFLDRISRDEFDFTGICTIPGRFGEGQPERKSCRTVPVVSSGSLDWGEGSHKLIGVAKDLSGNETTIERMIQIIGYRPGRPPAPH